MTDSALSNLYPTMQIGSDGFQWWIGQVESDRDSDPKYGDRWKVRIIGIHPQSCDVVKSDDLPWASVMAPVNAPHVVGGITSVTTQLSSGCWVVGFFLDRDKQQPMIMGSIGRVPESKSDKDLEKETPEKGCLSFTTYKDPENIREFEQSSKENTSNAYPDRTGAGLTETKESTNFQETKDGPAVPTNPSGTNICIDIADKCGKETDMSNTFTILFSEMLYETQRNNGKLGDYLVGKVSGKLYDAKKIGRKYINKAIRVIRTFIASVKGYVVEKIKIAVERLTNLLLSPNELGASLAAVTEFFNSKINFLGCLMAELEDRLAKFLEDLIFGYLFNIYKSAACQVDKFIQGILSKINSQMQSLLEQILGPLQSLLGAIASPLNMIGEAINYVMGLLGIQCSGPGKGCGSTTRYCLKGEVKEREKDFLDKLIDTIQDDMFPATGEDWSQYTCDDAFSGTKLDQTEVVFVGGIQNPKRSIDYTISDIAVAEGDMAKFTVKRRGNVELSSSVSYSTRDGTAFKDVDYQETSGLLGFAPGEEEKIIEVRTFRDAEDDNFEDFFMRIFRETPTNIRTTSTKSSARCTIQDFYTDEGDIKNSIGGIYQPGGSNPNSASDNPNNKVWENPAVPDIESGTTIIENADGSTTVSGGTEDTTTTFSSPSDTYEVTADKVTVKEGDFITYTIKTENVPYGSELAYTLFGTGITPSDIVSNSLRGSFVVENYGSYNAQVVVGISQDLEIESAEKLVFGIDGTGATVSVLIESDTSSFSEEELSSYEDGSSSSTIPDQPKSPTIGEIVTGPVGEIIDIPIRDSGDPYKEPPNVLISGNGTRAVAIALTDENGFVSEIRVTDPGYDYKINDPMTSKKECIIDSFTMIRPGKEYETEPTVFLNGDSSIAESVINSKGQVTSIRIKNRSITFSQYPEIQILGGGGYGAKFLPSFRCLDPDERVKLGSAKIGTGSYIDCP